MVRRPMVVDDSGDNDLDDDDLDLADGAAAGQATAAAATTDGGGGGQGDEASPDKEKKKSVRLAADGELAVRAWCLPQPSGCTHVQAWWQTLVQVRVAHLASTPTVLAHGAMAAALQIPMQMMTNRASRRSRQSKAAASSRTRCLLRPQRRMPRSPSQAGRASRSGS